MSNDPYAAASDFQDYHEDGPPKTSILAILSLVCSLICFIPGLSAIGSLLGVFGLLRITSSNGRIKGTGLAIAGIAIGVIVSLIWFGIAFAAQKALQQYTAFGQVITHVDTDSYDAARGMLTRDSRVFATDEMLAQFKADYETEAGALVGWPKGITGIFGSFMDLGKNGQQPDQTLVPYRNAMPLPGEFATGTRLVWIVLSEDGQVGDSSGLPAIINVAVQRTDSTMIWLIDPDVQKAGVLLPSDGSEVTPAAEDTEPVVTPAGDG